MRKQRIAILGGGLGGMSAAFHLTSTPELRAKYDVTVYQQGWRLGGKGATGRNPTKGERVEEHGLHMFLGFYEHAFRMMRACFAEWDRPAGHPWKSIDDAFEPQRRITLQEQVGGRWETWSIDAPWLPGEPGVDDGFGLLASPGERLRATLEFVHRISNHLPGAGLVAGVLQRIVALLERAGLDLLTSSPMRWMLRALIREAQIAASAADKLFASYLQTHALERRALYLIEVALAAAHGFVVDILPHLGEPGDPYDRINGEEFKAYLVRHHLPSHLQFWAPIKALYDLGFAYVGGDASRADNGNIAAGVALNIFLRMATAYKNAPLFRMRAGMGDTIFTPLYQVLRQRGVHFEFFRRVEKVHLAPGGSRIAKIDLAVQADPLVAGCSYRPLVRVGRMDCWPSEPLWGELAPGTPHVNFESAWCTTKLRTESLHDGNEFDLAVLAISKAALPAVVGDLATKPRWANMLATVPTTMTQAAQLWLRKTTHELGFAGAATVMTGYTEPFDSWADMSEVLSYERWPASADAKSLQYFCSPMKEPTLSPTPPTDPTFPATQKDGVRALLRNYLDRDLAHLMPHAVGADGKFDDALLVDVANAVGPARLDAQYVRANVDPTERYVQSFAGTIAARLRADNSAEGSGVENLFLAGDWIRTELNAGSAEAAVQSGVDAARAIGT